MVRVLNDIRLLCACGTCAIMHVSSAFLVFFRDFIRDRMPGRSAAIFAFVILCFSIACPVRWKWTRKRAQATAGSGDNRSPACLCG